ncbi:hypothetical protein CLCR_00993 [Cladophialophora carrionii]|uniref:Uncharacterized protein n=1 Tax=Cladophialophora carrionii TaxID=86049 RepID=A0A1C1D104_9EURO|nr:hypothetical protein CLCR_00993 [Cladophialophora carrionii]
MTGFGFCTVFQAALNYEYLVDTFSGYAASAVAANTLPAVVLCRSVSIFPLPFSFFLIPPLAIAPLYNGVGIPWDTSLFWILLHRNGACAVDVFTCSARADPKEG